LVAYFATYILYPFIWKMFSSLLKKSFQRSTV
jgi:hypothetical protein